MAHMSVEQASDHVELDTVQGHYGQLDAYTVAFETYLEDDDPAPLFVGLPDDACQARHWGVVLEGTLVLVHVDGGEEVIGAGQAYYAPPGHRPIFRAGTRVVEFSVSTELEQTMAVIQANLDALHAS